ncbi:hypothetical protein HMPREF9162_2212 [Selenomonas sp. oral taxon 137 str. F0430]|nr:hypothetical protein HMPREF9162_2212 [Selenomonas sp. oral taxon 137 str. F0430]
MRDLDHVRLLFQSTRPVRGATDALMKYQREGKFQSTRPVRGATVRIFQRFFRGYVSIHAPRAGRDKEEVPILGRLLFQSTRPVRGATSLYLPAGYVKAFQSTRPVRGATLPALRMPLFLSVSIHAPRAGRDEIDFSGFDELNVSIHAPRAGRDSGH